MEVVNVGHIIGLTKMQDWTIEDEVCVMLVYVCDIGGLMHDFASHSTQVLVGHFEDVVPSRSLGLVLKKENL